jgi:hypothetical protein
LASTVTKNVTYEDLYSRWERGNWSATEIDFSEDREHWWGRLSEFERRAALWNYALFFWGEDAVTDGLSPYIDAAPREEQKYFLATQQVDEARHAVFFARFMREVPGLGDSIGTSLDAIQPELTWGFRKVFDRLERMTDELRRDRSRPKLAAALTLYHLIIEASLAQPGQHMIERYLQERELLPGFRAGMENVARDEQRHVGFGVKLLSDLVREDPDCRHAVADLLREVLPWTTAVLLPPGWDRNYTEVFGFTLEEIGAHGARSLDAKLRAAGLAVETLPGSPPMPPDMTPEERADRGIKLLIGGVLGPKLGPPKRDRETESLLFDTVRRAVNPHHGLDRAAVLQWEFPDAEPWFVRIDNGSTSASPGRAPEPDLTIGCRYEDWVDIVAGRRDPRRALATGALRPRGSLRLLLRLPRIFGSTPV